VYYVSFYTVRDPGLIPEVYPRHRAFVDEVARDGGIASIGTFGDPVAEGAMCVFRSADAAEAFLAGDPFVTEGVVTRSPVRSWDPLEYDPDGRRTDG
jgi:uncharacterized protein YciI